MRLGAVVLAGKRGAEERWGERGNLVVRLGPGEGDVGGCGRLCFGRRWTRPRVGNCAGVQRWLVLNWVRKISGVKVRQGLTLRLRWVLGRTRIEAGGRVRV